MFTLQSSFSPRGDQQNAIDMLADGIAQGTKHQALLGVTGSGKTYTMASVIERADMPTLVISPNKTLAAQLYQEFKSFFPNDEVHYFVSYYDYYQPEAYIPHTNTYIQKDARINKNIDRLRHAALQALLTKRNVIVVASVSCIYGLGNPEDYRRIRLELAPSQRMIPARLIAALTALRYVRTEKEPKAGEYRKHGSALHIHLVTGERIIIRIADDVIADIRAAERQLPSFTIYPAQFWITPEHKLAIALENIKQEMEQRVEELQSANRFTEAERLEQRTLSDIEDIAKNGTVPGIENYSRHLSFRNPGEPPATLLNYFPKDYLLFIDESHLTVPQIHGMQNGDRQRKAPLISYGWRLPSALDNRPLTFDEFTALVNQVIFVSATPGGYEMTISGSSIAEQIVRPTGILDPQIVIKPASTQIEDLLNEIRARTERNERTLALTLTKRQSEDLTEFLLANGIRANYLHSEIKTLDRPRILSAFRRGEYDVLVGINLLREGLDMPEVGLVAILDADREGFLRNARSIIQVAGRAARSIHGTVILYADSITGSMKTAINETGRRRRIQAAFNERHGIEPQSIVKSIADDNILSLAGIIAHESGYGDMEHTTEGVVGLEDLRRELKEAVEDWEFERAEQIKFRLKDETR